MTAVLNLFDEDSEPYGPKPRDYTKEAEATAKRLDKRNAIRSEVGLSSTSPSTGLTNPLGAPPLDWWVIGTKDESLQRVIRAMVPEKVCRTCGEPSRRITENPNAGLGSNYWNAAGTNSGESTPIPWTFRPKMSERDTIGWTDCGHDDWRPGVWLDPFNPEAT